MFKKIITATAIATILSTNVIASDIGPSFGDWKVSVKADEFDGHKTKTAILTADAKTNSYVWMQSVNGYTPDIMFGGYDKILNTTKTSRVTISIDRDLIKIQQSLILYS